MSLSENAMSSSEMPSIPVIAKLNTGCSINLLVKDIDDGLFDIDYEFDDESGLTGLGMVERDELRAFAESILAVTGPKSSKTSEERESLELALAVLSGYIRRLPAEHREEPQRQYDVLWALWNRSADYASADLMKTKD